MTRNLMFLNNPTLLLGQDKTLLVLIYTTYLLVQQYKLILSLPQREQAMI